MRLESQFYTTSARKSRTALAEYKGGTHVRMRTHYWSQLVLPGLETRAMVIPSHKKLRPPSPFLTQIMQILLGLSQVAIFIYSHLTILMSNLINRSARGNVRSNSLCFNSDCAVVIHDVSGQDHNIWETFDGKAVSRTGHF